MTQIIGMCWLLNVSPVSYIIRQIITFANILEPFKLVDSTSFFLQIQNIDNFLPGGFVTGQTMTLVSIL